jgi:hypothetical protein
LSSCNNGGGDSNAAPLVDVGGTQKKSTTKRASCDYAFDEGGASPLALPVAHSTVSRFLKTYDSSLIDAVQESSGSETERFADLTGVTFYKVNDLDISERDCLFTKSLPDAPSSIAKYFRTAEDSVKGVDGGKSTLLGFYLDKQRVESLSGATSIGPVITIKDDGERYTMVHEFFHHVFDLSKPVSGTQLQINLSGSAQVVSDAMDKYNADGSAANLQTLAIALDKQSQDLIKVLKEYTLEEMTIEFELNQRYERKVLKYVNKYSRLNGDFYIVSSAESALARIQKNEELIAGIEDDAKLLPSTDRQVILQTWQEFENYSSI